MNRESISRFRTINFRGILLFLALLGPGVIATSAGNDAGGVATYAVAGAEYGYHLLWLMIPLTVAYWVVQDISARLGAATGKGFSDLVRENFSIQMTVFIMGLLTLANASLVVSEFAGVAASFELMGVTKYISVPLAAAFIWWLVVKGSYRKAEKIFLLMSALLLAYIPAAIVAKPDWNEVLHQGLTPHIYPQASYLSIAIALLGTTISPYIQIITQSFVVEKGVTMIDFAKERVDTIVGVLVSNLVSVFIIIATGATLYLRGIHITTAADAALALSPIAGDASKLLFGIGFLGASLLAAGILPLTASFTLANAFGWESGVNRTLEEAPIFYAVFTVLVVASATIVLSPAISLIGLLLNLQILNALVLPFELYVLLKLVCNYQLMGKYVPGKLFTSVAIVTTVAISLVSLLYIGTNFYSVTHGLLDIWKRIV